MSFHPARVYVDESYGDDQSFLVQTAISLPAGNAELAFYDILNRKIAESPKFTRAEFKAGSLDEKNRSVYEWFLQQAINVLAAISDKTPCRTVISIDSMAKYKSDIYTRLYATLKGSLHDIGYPAGEIEEAREFIRQVIWLHARLPDLVPAAGAGNVELYFDKKYRLDQKFEEEVAAWVPRGAARVLKKEKRWKTYTRLLNILFKVLPTTRAFPTVSVFTYIDSRSNYLVQAADLLSNLMLNAIRHRMGATNPRTEMKYKMLRAVMDAEPVHAGLLKSLTVSGGKVLCSDNGLFSGVTLLGA